MSEKKESIFLPSVKTIESAKKASRYGIWAALFSAGVTALLSTWALATGNNALGVDAWAYIDAAIFAAIAFGIHREKLWAAILGLVFFSIEKLFQIFHTGQFQSALVALILILCYVSSVRGLYALRNLRRQEGTIDDSA